MMNSGAAFSQIRRVIDLKRRCFFSARWRGDTACGVSFLLTAIKPHIPTQFSLFGQYPRLAIVSYEYAEKPALAPHIDN